MNHDQRTNSTENAEGNGGLPEGWAWTTIGAACDLNPPKTAKNALPDDAPMTFVPMPAVDAECGSITAPEERAFAEVRKGYTSFREGDVIVAKITPCMENGKAAIARGLTNGLGFGSTEFHDILFTWSGTVGRCAIATDEQNGYLMTFHSLRVRSNPAKCETKYLYYAFRGAPNVRRQTEEGAIGSTRAGFNTNLWGGLDIPLPPLAEQREIVRRVEALYALADAAARLRSDRLTQAILANAFRGELVPTEAPLARQENRPYEPASALLAASAARATQRARSQNEGGLIRTEQPLSCDSALPRSSSDSPDDWRRERTSQQYQRTIDKFDESLTEPLPREGRLRRRSALNSRPRRDNYGRL